MTSIADKLGFGPKREHAQRADGSWRVSVTPPAMLELPTQSVVLSADQYARYQMWREGCGLIQELLPELSFDQREVLMTGIGGEDFAKIWPEDEA